MVDARSERSQAARMRWIWSGLLAVAVLLLPGCTKKKPEDLTKVTKADIAKPSAVITDEEVKQFAADMEQSLEGGDAAAFRRLLHLDGMFYRIFPQEKVEQHPQLKEAQAGWKRAVETNIFRSLQSFRLGFLRVVRDGDGIKARFRLAGEGINYWDVLLDRNAGGRVAIVDFLDYLAGEFVTDGQRRLMQQLMPALLSGGNDKVRANAEMRQLQRISALSAMIRQGRHAEFLEEYDRLEGNLKQQRTLMYMRVMAANTVAINGQGGEVYTQAVDDYRREHANAVNLELMLIDYYFLGKKYEDAIWAVNGLSRRVGGDPYLDLLIGNAHYAAGELAKAKVFLEGVIKAFPWEQAAYQTLVVMAAAEEEYQTVTELLIAGEKDAGLKWELESAEEFAGFRESAEYRKWKDR